MSNPRYTLPAAIYDAIKAEAEAAGGIGAGQFVKHNTDGTLAPVCLYGCARFVDWKANRKDGESYFEWRDRAFVRAISQGRAATGEAQHALQAARIDPTQSDCAVYTVRRETPARSRPRVSWDEYTKALGLDRGAPSGWEAV